jgi:adenylate kinase
MTVVVSGVPGVGASRVCERARRDLGDEYTLINFGDVMLEEALEHGLTDSREGLSALPVRDQRTLQRRAGEYVARKAAEGPLLVNTHLVIHTDHGFIPGLPSGVRTDVNPSAFVVVDAPVDTIQQRRQESERAYLDEGRGAVEFYRHLQSAAAFTYSAASDVPVRYVSNDELDEAGDRLGTLVEDIPHP